MILDTSDNLQRYKAIFHGFDPSALFDWLAGTCRETEPGEKVSFCGDLVFAKSHLFDTVPSGQAQWESHREYADLQYILSGGEIIEWAPASDLLPRGSYDKAADVQFYEPGAARVFLPLKDGMFVFLSPRDAHKPVVSDGRNASVRKIVVKIHCSVMVI